MGWNPQFSFKLRDDEVTFGDLVLDKNGAQFLSEMLINIRNGVVPDLGMMKSILDDYCYTNDEFIALKDEMYEIEEDIAEFKRIGSNALQKWSVFMQTIVVHTSYIVGSDTWIERYKELKMIGANMFDSILKCGYNFGEERLAALHKRYDEVIGCTSGMERVGGYLQKQYREAVVNGDENALDNFCKSMVETGVWSQEVADRERKKREVNNLLNTAEGGKQFEEALKRKQSQGESSQITVTWDMWISMCNRVDDYNPYVENDNSNQYVIREAEQVLDQLCFVYAKESGLEYEQIKEAHLRPNTSARVAEIINNSKQCIDKSIYDKIMNIATFEDAAKESGDAGYETLTQEVMMKAIKAFYDSRRVDFNSLEKAREILCDMYNEINKELDVLDMARNYSTSQDFMVLMETAISMDTVGPMIDSAAVQYPKSKINTFYSLCGAKDTEETSATEQGEENTESVTPVNNSSEGEEVDTKYIKTLYDAVAKFIDVNTDCSADLITAMYDVVNNMVQSYNKTGMPLPDDVNSAISKLAECMNGTSKMDSLKVMNDTVCMFVDNKYPHVVKWFAKPYVDVFRFMHTRIPNMISLFDIVDIYDAMNFNWLDNKNWANVMPVVLSDYADGVKDDVPQENKGDFELAVSRIQALGDNVTRTYETDRSMFRFIIDIFKSILDIVPMYIAVDENAYKTFYMFIDKENNSNEPTDSPSEMISVTQYDIQNLSNVLPNLISPEYKNALCIVLTAFLNGCKSSNNKPVTDFEITSLNTKLNTISRDNQQAYQKGIIKEYIDEACSVHGIIECHVNVSKALWNYLMSGIMNDTIESMLNQSTEQEDTISICQEDISKLYSALGNLLDADDRRAIMRILSTYMHGLLNWAPVYIASVINEYIQLIERLQNRADNYNVDETVNYITETIKTLTCLQEIDAICVNVDKKSWEYIMGIGSGSLGSLQNNNSVSYNEYAIKMVEEGKVKLDKDLLKFISARLSSMRDNWSDACNIVSSIMSTYANAYVNTYTTAEEKEKISSTYQEYIANINNPAVNKLQATLNMLNALICIESEPDAQFSYGTWVSFIAKTYIRIPNQVEFADIAYLCDNMQAEWFGNYTWCNQLQKLLQSYTIGIDQFVYDSHKVLIQETLNRINSLFIEEKAAGADMDDVKTVRSFLERFSEVKHVGISISPKVYIGTFYYLSN